MSVLIGPAVTAGLDASALGLTFCQIPAGTYEVGDAEHVDNPPRSIILDSFELARTPTTNNQWEKALEQLGGKNTVLMFELVQNRRWAVLARGTEREVKGVRMSTLKGTVSALRDSLTVGDLTVGGAIRAFGLDEEPAAIVPVIIRPHRTGRGFDNERNPALMTYFESAAVAALYGWILPTGEMWEAAASDLRDWRIAARYHQNPGFVTTREVGVGSVPPNRFGLFDMLGNVRTWMANRLEEGKDRREVRGSSWQRSVHATYRFGLDPDYQDDETSGRFAHQVSRG